MNSNPRDALKKKLWRKINAYAAVRAAYVCQPTQDIGVELELQHKQLDQHIDRAFDEVTQILRAF